ncbi:MAG TPA: hypothetical protein PLO53_01245 [Candidatus Hydrogenedentes bacterium]|nr:hypothetical protein [Candidatus Hydrogenedentota bacterium]
MNNLDQRDRIGLMFVFFVAVLVLMMAAYIPRGPRQRWLNSESALTASRSALQEKLLQYADQQDRLARQKQLMELLEKRPSDFSLFALMDNLLNKTGLRSKAQLEQYRPRGASARQPMVQLRMQGVALSELVSLLHETLKRENVVAVYKVDALKPAVTGKGLDCDITFATVVLEKNGAEEPAAPAAEG